MITAAKCSSVLLVLTFHCISQQSVSGKADKYSATSNEGVPQIGKKYGEKLTHHQRDDRPFRSEKLNLLWSKAVKKFGKEDPEVIQLFGDLRGQDKLEMDLKRQKLENKDSFGEYDAIVRQKLLTIMSRYELSDHFYDVNAMQAADENETFKRKTEVNDKEMTTTLKDKRLVKIWTKAQAAYGFTDAELNDLKLEMIHQQQKIDEFSALKEEIDAMHDVHENSIDRFKMGSDYVEDLKSKKQELKRLHNEMKDNYNYLEVSATKVEDETSHFSDPRVVSLWAQVKSSNFTDEELEGFKEELFHFERRIDKHKYLRNEIVSSQGEKLTSADGKAKLNYEDKLGKKVEEYGRKIKKLYTDLRSRIDRSAGVHSEL